MKRKFNKKSLLSLGAFAAAFAPVATIVSCSDQVEKNYDFGLATAPVNSLNYVRFKDTTKVVSSMVEGVFKIATKNKIIQSTLTFPKMEYQMAVETNEGDSSSASLTGRFYDMKNQWGVLPGTAISSVDGNPIVALHKNEASQGAVAIALQLGDKHKWSNGDKVTAQDYIDTLKYVLDVNTGSQLIIDAKESGIKNASLIVTKQQQYIKQFKKPYVDPFGYDGWESQTPGDENLVKEIREAAIGFGAFTKEDYKMLASSVKATPDQYQNSNAINRKATIGDFHKSIEWWGTEGDGYAIPQVVADSNVLFVEFEDSRPQDVGNIFEDLTSRNFFLPINRKFVESTGGIQKFGVDKEHFLWNSAFRPDEVYLGPSGFITLEKDPLYYNASRTVSNRVKIFFQSDPMVLASMFEDGYIGEVNVPATHQKKFWADLSKRPYMKKNSGFGTQALSLNLDTGNEALKDENFRKALAFAIDRNAMTKIAAQETSFPVTTWTAFGTIMDSFGIPIETFFNNQNYVPYEGAKTTDGKDLELPIQSYDYTTHNAKTNQFEHVDRTDIGYNVEIARHFIEEYKKAHPDKSSVSVTYVYDGNATTKNIGVYLQSLLKEAFGGFVNLEIKGLPSNVFESARTGGDYDILFYNYDSYGTEIDSYIKRFFIKDGIDKDNQKQTGFRENPSGAFTYGEWLAKLQNNPTKLADVKSRLQIADYVMKDEDGKNLSPISIWDKVIELSTQNPNESDEAYEKRLQNFFVGNLPANASQKDMIFTEQKAIILVVTAFEKIIREAMPIIPLMEVDTMWEAKTIAGVDSLSTYSLQTAYGILDNKPAALPGIEAIKG